MDISGWYTTWKKEEQRGEEGRKQGPNHKSSNPPRKPTNQPTNQPKVNAFRIPQPSSFLSSLLPSIQFDQLDLETLPLQLTQVNQPALRALPWGFVFSKHLPAIKHSSVSHQENHEASQPASKQGIKALNERMKK